MPGSSVLFQSFRYFNLVSLFVNFVCVGAAYTILLTYIWAFFFFYHFFSSEEQRNSIINSSLESVSSSANSILNSSSSLQPNMNSSDPNLDVVKPTRPNSL